MRNGTDARRHRCEPGWNLEQDEKFFPYNCFGTAIDYCFEDDGGRLWAGNTEYETQVNFCPFCGYPAETKIDWSG